MSSSHPLHQLARQAADAVAVEPGASIGVLLRELIASLRDQLGDPTAPVVVISPSSANGTLLRQQLARAGSFVRVEFLTPERLVHTLGRDALLDDPRHIEPPGWLSATLGHLLNTLDDDALAGYRDTLAVPGWRTALEQAVQRLEEGRVDPERLREVAARAPRPRRLTLLANLVEAVADARRRDHLLGPVELQRAACAGRDEPGHHALERVRAAIVIGDRTLAPTLYEALVDWCSRRAVVRAAVDPLEQVQPAPLGLRAAAFGLPEVFVPAPGGTRALDHLRTHLFRPTAPAAAADTTDDSLILARTPDELRELDEIVRAVQRAIVDDQVPLDEIAIVLPNAEHADVLQAALERAGIPATWLLGPSLARSPAASFLTLALDMAQGPATAEQLYELLVQPAFALRARLGPRATAGRGRWRRLLARCGAHRGCEALIDAMQARLADARDPDADRTAVDSLSIALRAVREALDALPEHATVPEHASALHTFLKTWWLPSADRERTLDVLAGWGQRPIGPVVDRATAAALVAESLVNTQLLDGHLGAPRVRVLPPMSALGASVRRVFVAGLDEGRFPRPRREHPVLGDDEVAFLADTLGVRLVDSSDHADTERRRLASALSAATERLWLSWAGSDMLAARPRLPGRLLLEVATALLGRRATFADLREHAREVGSRGRPVPDAAEHALGELEHLCARAARGDATPDVLDILATHPVARRLLALHRAQARLRQGERAGELAAYVHRVDAARLETPDAERATTAADLARLVLDPGGELLDRQLGARRAPRFYADAGFERRAHSRAQRALLVALEGDAGTLEQRFVEALTGLEDAHGADTLAEASREALHTLALETFARWQAAMPVEHAVPCALDEPVVPDGLDVALEGSHGLVDDAGTCFEVRHRGDLRKTRLEDRLELVLQAMALQAADREVARVTVTKLDGTRQDHPLDDWRPEALACTRRILALRRAGRLAGLPDALRLAGDPTSDVLSALDDAALADDGRQGGAQ